jgi:predicted O-methyltransferase YrrM
LTASADSRARLRAALEGVQGWLADDEAWALHGAVAGFPAAGAIRIVEIGSWKGRSTITLASGLATRAAGGVVHAVDPHRGGVAHRLLGEADTFGAFLANLERAGVRELVDPIRATSAAARGRVPDGSVHVLFVDGSHRYGDVLHDLDVWRPALRPGARVAFHDAVAHPGVAAALRRRALSRGSPFRAPRLVQETLFFDYRPALPWRRRDSGRALATRGMLTALRARRHVAARYRHLRDRLRAGASANDRTRALEE